MSIGVSVSIRGGYAASSAAPQLERRHSPADDDSWCVAPSARPGDRVFCFSDPMGERSYFSAGIVNRLAELAKQKNGGARPLILDVSTDWAPGSSGAAVIDECGNAIGLVSTILALQDDEEGVHSKRQHSTATWMVLHGAVSAREVKALIRASDREGEHG